MQQQAHSMGGGMQGGWNGVDSPTTWSDRSSPGNLLWGAEAGPSPPSTATHSVQNSPAPPGHPQFGMGEPGVWGGNQVPGGGQPPLHQQQSPHMMVPDSIQHQLSPTNHNSPGNAGGLFQGAIVRLFAPIHLCLADPTRSWRLMTC